jgi:hypothetical protein
VSFSVLTAGEYIYGGRAVAVSSSGYAILADPFSADRSRVVGISAAPAETGERVRIITAEIAPVSTAGMTLGRQAYLSIEASGTLTTNFSALVASGYNEFYDPFYVTKVGNALGAGTTKIEIEDGVLVISENTALLTEDQSPLIEYLVAEDGSKILLENA